MRIKKEVSNKLCGLLFCVKMRWIKETFYLCVKLVLESKSENLFNFVFFNKYKRRLFPCMNVIFLDFDLLP